MKFVINVARLKVGQKYANRGEVVDIRNDELPTVKHLMARRLISRVMEELPSADPEGLSKIVAPDVLETVAALPDIEAEAEAEAVDDIFAEIEKTGANIKRPKRSTKRR